MAKDELIRDVDEAMRREYWQSMWRQFGDKIIYISIAVIVFTAALVYWQSHMLEQKQERSDQLVRGHELYMQGNYKAANDVFAAVGDKAKGHLATMAHIWTAKTELKLGSLDNAIAAYAKAIPTPMSTDSLVAYACLQGVMLAPEDARFNDCLPSKSNDAFYLLAQEAKTITKVAAGDVSAAEALSQEPLLPSSQARRLEDLKAYLSYTHND